MSKSLSTFTKKSSDITAMGPKLINSTASESFVDRVVQQPT